MLDNMHVGLGDASEVESPEMEVTYHVRNSIISSHFRIKIKGF